MKGQWAMIFLGAALLGCGSSGGSGGQAVGTYSQNPLNLPENEISWQGYANQREDFFDYYGAVKKCLQNSGLEVVRDSYPFVIVSPDEIHYNGNHVSGLTFLAQDVIYLWQARVPIGVISHELVHALMQWDNSMHFEPAFQTCGEIILSN